MDAREGKARVVQINEHNAGAHTLAGGAGDIVISTLDREVDYADLIKIDVEGMEPEVFEGGVKLIATARPIVFFEVNLFALRRHRNTLRKLGKFFRSRAYVLYFSFRRDGKLVLGTVWNLSFFALCIAPRAWFFRGPSAPFDVLAMPSEKVLPLPAVSVAKTLEYVLQENLRIKYKRFRSYFTDRAHHRRIIKKALTLRASSIGDCLMGKYLLENIHHVYPQARCILLVSSRGEMISDLLFAYPWLEIVEANRKNPLALLRAFWRCRSSDLTVTQYSGKGNEFSRISKLFARVVTRRGGLIGFDDPFPWNAYLYSTILPFHSDKAIIVHEQETLRVAGVESTIGRPNLQYTKNTSVLGRFDLVAQKYVVAHLFAGGIARGIDKEHRKRLILALRQRLPNDIALVLTGSEKEREELPQGLCGNTMVVAGKTSIQELITLIDSSVCMVSLDTGAAHIAAHLRKPLIVLVSCVGAQWWYKEQYGASVPEVSFSVAEKCRENHDYSGYAECLQAIDMDAVARKVADIFKSHVPQ